MQLRLLFACLGLVASLGVHARAEEKAPPPVAGALPSDLQFELHGYYRARFTNLANVPTARLDDSGTLASEPHVGRDDASDATFFHSRLRLEPSLRWGGDASAGAPPKVALHAQLDVLDTVVWGDNARQAAVPLFAGNPSQTGVDGTEKRDIFLRRLWLEVALPVGVLRVGRQASHGGLGILFNDGNGFRNDFGDADGGSTFDRVLFATRPITIFNAITRGDRRETPLVLVVGHDRLVEDTLGFGSKPAATDTRDDAGPFGWLANPTCGDAADPTGSAPTRKCDNAVGQWVTGLIWRDEALRRRQDTDELTLGALYVNRSQAFNASRLHILDAFWRLQLGLASTGPSLLTEGEIATIRGGTKGLKLLPGGLFDDKTGLAENALEGDILNWAARAGLTSRAWDGLLEVGHSSGDEQLIGGDGRFRMYPMHADHRTGLLLYPVALASRSYNTMAGRASDALHGGGGVFNSTYLTAKGRYRIQREGHQIELVGQALFGWAETLNGGRTLGFTADYYTPRDAKDPWANNGCGVFESACALGSELDLAVRLKWLPADVPGAGPHDKYLLHWTNELGLMRAGHALAPRLAEGAATLWTVQSRLAFRW